ncbi:MAG: YfiR/HmsC family protein [Campylobacterota bacterium]|nr:YfiR/HmsC family protein [Campylobacterota bacterium]
MKFFIFLFIFTTTIFATQINDSLLKIHAVLVPKIALMDYEFKQKIDNDSIVIALMYDMVNYKDALSLKEKIDTKYKDGIKNYSIKTKLVLYSKIGNTKANIYYIFPTRVKNIQKVVKKADFTQALTFSYSNDDLKYGVMLSLIVGSKIKPLINLTAIKSGEITFRPILLDISAIYTNDISDILKSIHNRGSIQNSTYIALLSIKTAKADS